MAHPPVVVHPPSTAGGRRVTIGDQDVGLATELADVVEFLRRAGLDEVEVEETDLIDWRGGSPDDWPVALP